MQDKRMVRKRSARSVEKEKQWLDFMVRWKQSGQTAKQFCKQESVPDKRFYYWQRKLRQRKLMDAQPTGVRKRETEIKFVPVTVKQDSGSPSNETGRMLLEIVTPGGYLVRIP